MKKVKFQHATPFRPDDYHKYVVAVVFDGETEWWGTDNPELALKELLQFYYDDWKDTKHVLPVTVFQKERYNEFDLKGDAPKLVTQDQVLREAREIIEQTTGKPSPATIGAVKQDKKPSTANKPKAQSKLETLADIEGYADIMDLLEAVSTDSVCPGICMNKDCDYTAEVEPDSTSGWCEECSTQTVKSALILAGVI